MSSSIDYDANGPSVVRAGKGRTDSGKSSANTAQNSTQGRVLRRDHEKQWIRELLNAVQEGKISPFPFMQLDEDLVYSAWMEAASVSLDRPADPELVELFTHLERRPEAGFLFGLARCYINQRPEERKGFEALVRRNAPKEAPHFFAWAAAGQPS